MAPLVAAVGLQGLGRVGKGHQELAQPGVVRLLQASVGPATACVLHCVCQGSWERGCSMGECSMLHKTRSPLLLLGSLLVVQASLQPGLWWHFSG